MAAILKKVSSAIWEKSRNNLNRQERNKDAEMNREFDQSVIGKNFLPKINQPQSAALP